MIAQIVCLDTNIFACFLRTSRDQTEEKIERSDELISQLKSKKAVIAIPSIVLAEVACFIPDDAVQSFFDDIKKVFCIFPFNELAAYHYSILTKHCRNVRVDGERWSKSADIKIISTALAHGASCLYSEDQDMPKLASDFLQVHSLPRLPPRQVTLLNTTPTIQ